ncbi:hypothetical protein HanPSC8_Chr17g0758421 [Helianthus annuus]|nr:hypothetical protein HanPSC8_Chr17g0758421 [Helianthus annuus]
MKIKPNPEQEKEKGYSNGSSYIIERYSIFNYLGLMLYDVLHGLLLLLRK